MVIEKDTGAMSSRGAAGRAERGARLVRLRADRELLAREHPYLNYNLDEANVLGAARGVVPMLLPDGQIDAIEIEVEFDRLYPARPPRVREVAGCFAPDDDRHIVGDGYFCLYLREVDEPDLRTTYSLHVFMLDVVCFLEQQLIYERIGRFPGPQWPHKRDAYALYIVEQLDSQSPEAAGPLWEVVRGAQPSRNAPCPCGCGVKYKKCHLTLANELARVAARHELGGFDYEGLRRYAGVAA